MAETWTAKFEALKARQTGKPLDARKAQALLVAEVAAAWLDRMDSGDELPAHFEETAQKLAQIVAALDPPQDS